MNLVLPLASLHPSARLESDVRRASDDQNQCWSNKSPQHCPRLKRSSLSQDVESLSYCVEYRDVLILSLVLSIWVMLCGLHPIHRE